jgi:hypothetical protein
MMSIYFRVLSKRPDQHLRDLLNCRDRQVHAWQIYACNSSIKAEADSILDKYELVGLEEHR